MYLLLEFSERVELSSVMKVRIVDKYKFISIVELELICEYGKESKKES